MQTPLLIPILGGGFTVAFLHAALPTHWLPFVLAGRAQGWSPRKVLTITAIAGAGHVLFTALLGLLVVGFGLVVDRWMGELFPVLAGGILLLLGAYYLTRPPRAHGHSHALGFAHGHAHDGDEICAHEHAHAPTGVLAPAASGPIDVADLREPRSDRAVVLALVAMLTLSPCEGFLPVFLSGVRFGWPGFIALTLALALATLLGMLVFTWLTLKGLQRFNLEGLVGHEDRILGAALVLIGLLVMVFRP